MVYIFCSLEQQLNWFLLPDFKLNWFSLLDPADGDFLAWIIVEMKRTSLSPFKDILSTLVVFLDLKPPSCEADNSIIDSISKRKDLHQKTLHTLMEYLSSNYFHLKVSKPLEYELCNDVWVEKICHFQEYFKFLRTLQISSFILVYDTAVECKSSTFLFCSSYGSVFYLLVAWEY